MWFEVKEKLRLKVNVEETLNTKLQNKTDLEKLLWLLDICYDELDFNRAQEALWLVAWPQTSLGSWFATRDFLTELAKIPKFAGLQRSLHSCNTTSNAELQIRVALSANRPELLANSNREIVPSLVRAFYGNTKNLKQAAQIALGLLEKQEAQEAFCEVVLEKHHKKLLEIVIQKNFYPTDLHKRALFFFLTEQWEKYEKLDFDARLMHIVYQNSSQELQSRIVKIGRAAGRPEMLQILNVANWSKLSWKEWQVVTHNLLENKQWEQAWELVKTAPPQFSRLLLQTLANQKWLPSGIEQQADFNSLSEQANQLKNHPSFGDILELVAEFKPSNNKLKVGWVSIDTNKNLVRLNLVAQLGKQTREYQSIMWDLTKYVQVEEEINAPQNFRKYRPIIESLLEKTPNIVLPGNYPIQGVVTPTDIRIYDGRLEVARINHNYKRPVALALSANSPRIVTGHEKFIAIWDLSTKSLVKAYEAHSSYVFQLFLDETDQRLISVDTNGEIKVWRSPLNELASTPLEKTSQPVLKATRKLAEADNLHSTDASWLDFITNLYAYRFRHEIEITDFTQTKASPLDIELED